MHIVLMAIILATSWNTFLSKLDLLLFYLCDMHGKSAGVEL